MPKKKTHTPKKMEWMSLLNPDNLPAISAGYMVLLTVFSALLGIEIIAAVVVLRLCIDIAKYQRMHTDQQEVAHGVAYENMYELSLFALSVSIHLTANTIIAQYSPTNGTLAAITIVSVLGTLIPNIIILHRTVLLLLNFNIHMASICAPVFSARPLYSKHARVAA